MFRLLVRPVRAWVDVLLDTDSSRRLAYGFALGMMLGLVPKGNLTAIALGVLVLTLQVNLGAAALGTGLFTWLTAWTDPLAHRIGMTVLSWPSVQTAGAWLFDRPLVAWTGLNNSVVFGSLVLGGVLFYPAYHLSFLLWERYRPRLAEKLQRYKAAKVLAGAETVTSWRLR